MILNKFVITHLYFFIIFILYFVYILQTKIGGRKIEKILVFSFIIYMRLLLLRPAHTNTYDDDDGSGIIIFQAFVYFTLADGPTKDTHLLRDFPPPPSIYHPPHPPLAFIYELIYTCIIIYSWAQRPWKLKSRDPTEKRTIMVRTLKSKSDRGKHRVCINDINNN